MDLGVLVREGVGSSGTNLLEWWPASQWGGHEFQYGPLVKEGLCQ